MEHAPFVPVLPWVAPFAVLLLGIAVLPLAAPLFWDSNLKKFGVAIGLSIPVAILYATHAPAALAHTGRDYMSFMVLLGSLFVVSGGVRLSGDLRATPGVNTAFLAIGALIASFIGTTGASMLLIRPVLETNAERQYIVHTMVFFIFLVSNVGGCLTPLGDPPLFLGYLQGVPFTWTFGLFPAWLFTSSLLLAVYAIWDTLMYARETPEARQLDRVAFRPLRLQGIPDLFRLAGIVLAAAFLDAPWREAAMLTLAVVSLVRAHPEIRAANRFSFHPIIEVAAIFSGIFITMLPALDILRANGSELGVHEPWQFFWATGGLSSFLDNAPTYLTFLALAQGLRLTPEVVGVPNDILMAISLGAVFMGATTYIGNGPNFMVRAIAEHSGIRMPGFAGYMLYSGAILIPVFVLVTWVFFL